MKKYILRSMPDVKNKNYFMFVTCVDDKRYFLCWNPKDATRFNTIGDAMRVSAEIYKTDMRKFQVIPVEED